MSAGEVTPSWTVQLDPRDTSDPFRPILGVGPLSQHDIDRIERVIRGAQKSSGLTFSVFVGVAEEDARGYAVRLHSALPDPATSVFLLVDPAFRALEIVTGAEAKRVLGDAECRLAAATMQSSFVAHDLAGGLTAGIQQLAGSAYEAPTMHLN